MATYTQSGRPLSIATNLEADALLLAGCSGREGVSQLFRYELDLLAEDPVDFADVLGKPATVTLSLPNYSSRFFSGIISRLRQGGRSSGPATFLNYRAILVPALWLLRKRVQSRVFQFLSVADILRK